MPTYAYSCECGRTFDAIAPSDDKATAQCACGRIAQYDFDATVHGSRLHDGTFKPYTEYEAAHKPVHFRTRAERDMFMRSRGLTYDRARFKKPKPQFKELITPDVAEQALAKLESGYVPEVKKLSNEEQALL